MFRRRLLILAICAAAFMPFAHAQDEDPRLYDFGSVKEGRVLTHKFEFKNDTGRVLKILNVSTSCGCTVSQVSRKNLPVGDTAQIAVRFKTRGYSGRVRQFVYVRTDNPGEPLVVFTVEAQVEK